jgi:hypothetical protein
MLLAMKTHALFLGILACSPIFVAATESNAATPPTDPQIAMIAVTADSIDI